MPGDVPRMAESAIRAVFRGARSHVASRDHGRFRVWGRPWRTDSESRSRCAQHAARSTHSTQHTQHTPHCTDKTPHNLQQTAHTIHTTQHKLYTAHSAKKVQHKTTNNRQHTAHAADSEQVRACKTNSAAQTAAHTGAQHGTGAARHRWRAAGHVSRRSRTPWRSDTRRATSSHGWHH